MFEQYAKSVIGFITVVVFFMTQSQFANALSSTNYKIQEFIMDLGGGKPTSTNYKMQTSIGQPTEAKNITSTNYKLGTGYLFSMTDVTNPVVTGAALLDTTPTAGDASVTITFTSIVENYPESTDFTHRIDSAGVNGTNRTTTDAADTTAPGNELHTLSTWSESIDGGDRILATVLHTDKSGNTGSNTSPFYYVEPYQPSAPTVNTPTSSSIKVTINRHASEDANIKYSINDVNRNKFVQADGTLGVSEVFQTYTQWGGASGTVVTGLNAGTYEFKVRGQNYYDAATVGAYSTTAEGQVTSDFTFSIAGVNSGTATESITTDITTTSTTIPFGTVLRNSNYEAAQTLTVTTNGSTGYEILVEYNAVMSSTQGNAISDFRDSGGTIVPNSAPIAWATPSGAYDAYLGYHTSDVLLQSGTTNRFSADNTYAAFSTTAQQIGYNASPVPAGESTTVVTRLEIGNLQRAGNYQTNVNYTAYARF